MAAELPYHDYIEYYGPDYRLHIVPTNMENLNSREYIEKCKYVPNLLNLIHLAPPRAENRHHSSKHTSLFCH